MTGTRFDIDHVIRDESIAWLDYAERFDWGIQTHEPILIKEQGSVLRVSMVNAITVIGSEINTDDLLDKPVDELTRDEWDALRLFYGSEGDDTNE